MPFDNDFASLNLCAKTLNGTHLETEGVHV